MHPALTPAPAGTRGPVSVHPWAYPFDEVVRRFDVNPLCGLSMEEAARRRGALGPNLVEPDPTTNPGALDAARPQWSVFASAAAEWTGLRAAYQALQRLWTLPEPVSPAAELERQELTARVLRSDRVLDIPAADVVPGDIVLLAQGDTMVADGRLLDVVELRVDEEALTGWSFPSSRCVAPVGNSWTPLADRRSMVHAGGKIVYGAGIAVVVATGPLTALGRAALASRPVSGSGRGNLVTCGGDDEMEDEAAAASLRVGRPLAFRLRTRRDGLTGRRWTRSCR